MWNQPYFASGGALSASAQANVLAEGLRLAHDRYAASVQLPFTGYGMLGQPTTWAIRHDEHATNFYYQVEKGASVLTFKYDDIVIGTLGAGATGWQAGTFDLTAHALTPGHTYIVKVEDGGGDWGYRVWCLRENLNLLGGLSLHSFADGTIPTATHWNALATAIGDLHRAADATQAPTIVPHTGFAADTSAKDYLWVGTLNHRGGLLAYNIDVQNNYNGTTGVWTQAIIRVNGANLLTLATSNTFRGHWTNRTGTVALPGSVNVGEDYRVHVAGLSANGDETDGARVVVNSISEVPTGTQAAALWAAMTDWQHADYVNSARVAGLRNNVLVLHGAYTTSTHYAAAVTTTAGNSPRMVRTKRLLRYLGLAKPEPGKNPPAPEVIFTDGTLNHANELAYQNIGLPDASDDWGVYDLHSIAGLFTGMPYRLTNVRYAYESDQ